MARGGGQQNGVDDGRVRQAHLFRKRSQQFEVVIGMQDAGGVRLEGDNHRVRVPFPGSAHDGAYDVTVSAVHAVKVTDADDRGTEVAGEVVELAKGSHSARST